MRVFLLAALFLALVGAGLAGMAGWQDAPVAVFFGALAFFGFVLASAERGA